MIDFESCRFALGLYVRYYFCCQNILFRRLQSCTSLSVSSTVTRTKMSK